MNFFNTEKGKAFLKDAEARYKSRQPITVGTFTEISATDIDDKKRLIKRLQGIKDTTILTTLAIKTRLAFFEEFIERAMQ